MSAPDDELVRRYREASAQEDARPGAHVRDAVRAHAQMMAAAAATAPAPSANASSRAAANQSRWKLSALATVALVGLTGLLMLQFERGTPEERDTAFGQRRAPAPAAVPVPKPPATPAKPEGSQGSAHDLARQPPSPTSPKPAAAPTAPIAPTGQSSRLAKTVPPTAPAAAAPAPAEAESLSQPGAADAPSGFPASPPLAEDRATPPRLPPAPAPAPSAAMRPRVEMRERSALQDESPAPRSLARSLPGGNAANRDTGAAASPQSHKALNPSLLPRALRDAARKGNTGEVENLIAQGAPVDARDTAGRTALMLAALNGHAAAVQKLLALGAQTSLVDGDGLTAAQLARRWGYSAIADLIDAAR